MRAGCYCIYLVFLVLIGWGRLSSMVDHYHSSKWWDEHAKDKYIKGRDF